MAIEYKEASKGSSSTPGIHKQFWRKLWSTKVPLVARVFLWKACSNILPTKANLCKKRAVEDPLCPICKLEGETVEHILWNCESAKDVWSTIQKLPTMEMDFASIITILTDRLEDEELQLVTVIARLIWLQRNNVVFRGVFMSPAQILETAVSQLENYSKAEKGRRMESHKKPAPTIVKWRKPSPGWIKFNWDAAIDLECQRMGIGIIARDHTGTFLAAVSTSMPGVTDPTTAEAITSWKMAEACVTLGYSKVILEGDSIEIVNSMQSDGSCWSRYGTMINNTKVLLDSLQEWKVSHARRTANVAAHLLAKHGLTVDAECMWQFDFPVFLFDIVLVDKGSPR